MEILQMYLIRDESGPSLPIPSWWIVSGGRAQEFGLSPWADWVALDASGQPTDQWWDDQGSPRTDLQWVHPEAPFPTARDDGSPLEVGDGYRREVYGGSGAYHAWYEWDGTAWVETATTIPWQLRT